jgi:hypothetical protein
MPTVLVVLLFLPISLFASTINLGVVSFDTLVPGSGGTRGVNVFDISNLTSVNALPPDFPVIDIFLSSSLTLTDSGGNSTAINLADIVSGGLDPTKPVEFADTFFFSSAVFTPNLSQLSFLLSDGTTFTADSAVLTAQLLASSTLITTKRRFKCWVD